MQVSSSHPISFHLILSHQPQSTERRGFDSWTGSPSKILFAAWSAFALLGRSVANAQETYSLERGRGTLTRLSGPDERVENYYIYARLNGCSDFEWPEKVSACLREANYMPQTLRELHANGDAEVQFQGATVYSNDELNEGLIVRVNQTWAEAEEHLIVCGKKADELVKADNQLETAVITGTIFGALLGIPCLAITSVAVYSGLNSLCGKTRGSQSLDVKPKTAQQSSLSARRRKKRSQQSIELEPYKPNGPKDPYAKIEHCSEPV